MVRTLMYSSLMLAWSATLSAQVLDVRAQLVFARRLRERAQDEPALFVRRQQLAQPLAQQLAARLVLDPRASRVTISGKAVRLTSHEFRVLSYLMHNRDRVVSQGELADHIYARDDDRDSNTVEVFVARLRKKVGAAAIVTVRGLGYRMEGA